MLYISMRLWVAHQQQVLPPINIVQKTAFLFHDDYVHCSPCSCDTSGGSSQQRGHHWTNKDTLLGACRTCARFHRLLDGPAQLPKGGASTAERHVFPISYNQDWHWFSFKWLYERHQFVFVLLQPKLQQCIVTHYVIILRHVIDYQHVIAFHYVIITTQHVTTLVVI